MKRDSINKIYKVEVYALNKLVLDGDYSDAETYYMVNDSDGTYYVALNKKLEILTASYKFTDIMSWADEHGTTRYKSSSDVLDQDWIDIEAINI